MTDHRSTVARLYTALAAGDTEALDGLLTDDCVLVDPMGSHLGREAIKRYSAEFGETITDGHFAIDALWDAGEATICEVTFTGSSPDGAIELRLCDVFGFHGDRIAFNRSYFDPSPLTTSVRGG